MQRKLLHPAIQKQALGKQGDLPLLKSWHSVGALDAFRVPSLGFREGVCAVLVVTPKKTCGFGATPGFGGDIPLFSVLVVTFFPCTCTYGGDKNHPHVVVTSTNRATFGGDTALSAQAALSQRR